LLIGHFEEKKKRELLDVVAVRKAVIAQQIAVIPEFLDDSVGGHSRLGFHQAERQSMIRKYMIFGVGCHIKNAKVDHKSRPMID